MTKTAAKFVIASAFALTAVSGTSFAQGGGFQWTKYAPTIESVATSEPTGVVHAVGLNSYGAGETKLGVVAEHEPVGVIAMGASCYYLVQNGTWLPSGATRLN